MFLLLKATVFPQRKEAGEGAGGGGGGDTDTDDLFI